MLSNTRSRNRAQLFCIKLCTQQRKGITQTLPLQEQTCKNEGPCCAQWNIFGSCVAVHHWPLSMRNWGCTRAVPEKQRTWRWDLVLWMEVVDGGFGKLLTIRLNFITVWFNIWLARTTLFFPFDLLDGEKPWSEEASKQGYVRPVWSMPLKLSLPEQGNFCSNILCPAIQTFSNQQNQSIPILFLLWFILLQYAVFGWEDGGEFIGMTQVSHQKNVELFYCSPFFVKFQENLPDFIELFDLNGSGWNFFFELDVSMSHKKMSETRQTETSEVLHEGWQHCISDACLTLWT